MVEYLPSKQAVAGSSPVCVTLSTTPKNNMMHNINTNNDDAGFSIKRTGSGKRTKRIAAPKQNKLNGRKAHLGMEYGKSVHGVLSAAVPAELYKQIVITAREEKINVSDLIRRGVMREIGAIRFSRALGLDPAIYGVAGNQPKEEPKAKPEQSVDRLTKVEARKAIRDLRKALKKLAN